MLANNAKFEKTKNKNNPNKKQLQAKFENSAFRNGSDINIPIAGP